MLNLKGYRTIIVNVLATGAAIAAVNGIDIPPDQLDNVATGIVSAMGIVNLFLRKITTTPVGRSE